MWQTIGHSSIKKLLEKQIERQQIPHAYLFLGPQGVGKKLLAREAASKILGAQQLGSHPDYIYYNAEEDFGMENLRKFLSSLGHKPFMGQHKVAVIDNLDRANMQMNNALLKTLEEPSPSTILFAIAGQNNLLPTVTSRCQVVLFNALGQEEMKEYIQQNKLTVTEELVSAAAGSPGRLQSLISDPETTAQLEEALSQLHTAFSGGAAEKILAVTALAEHEPEQLRNILLSWLYQQRQSLAQEPKRYRLIGAITEALQHLNGSFNKKMVLQRLLLQSHEA